VKDRTMSAEYDAALKSAALFNRADAGKLEVSGPDAPAFLSNLSTNDVKNLPLGGGCETYFLDHRAKTLFQALAYHVLLDGRRHAIWLETTPSYGEKLLKHLDKYLISEAVELSDVTAQFVQMHLVGPASKAVLEKAVGESIPDLAEFQHMERTFGANLTCSIRCREPLGLPGYDIVCLAAIGTPVRRALTDAGAVLAGADAYETLRVEAGTPVYGIDIDETRFVMEVGRAERAVSYAKGCFIGQEPIVMARDRAGHVNRAFLGLNVLEGGPLPSGAKLVRDGQEVGVATSSVFSPRLGAPVALGYLRRGNQDIGLKLDAESATGRQPVEVLGYPPVRAQG
jgi:folate-binding protein YgfZ